MLPKYLALAAIAATTVCALPQNMLVAKRSSKDWDKAGNVVLTFSPETVTIGDIELDEIFKQLEGACHTTGQCDTNKIVMNGWWVDAGFNTDFGNLELTLGPSGAYPAWIRNGLLFTLRDAVKAGAICGPKTSIQACQGGDKGCHTERYTWNQCEVPRYWGITFQDESVGNAAPPFMGVDVNSKNTDTEACRDMMDKIGEIAGAVNGAAGGIFSLAKLLCG